MRVHFFGEVGFLTAVDDFEAFSAQVAFERLAREWPAVAAPARQKGDALRANLLRMHAAGGHLAALSGAERLRDVVARDGDLAAEHQQPGVKVMAMVGFFVFGRKLANTGRKPSRRSAASNSVLSIASPPCLANLVRVLYSGIHVNYRERYQPPNR